MLKSIPLPDVEPALAQMREKFSPTPDQLIPLLQFAQAELGYLPPEAMRGIAAFLKVPASHVYGVATFYAQFRFSPLGKHRITVCRGTACHVRGGTSVIQEITGQLKIEAGATTADLMFSLETVACVGSCALAPVIVVDNRVYGKVTAKRMREILDEMRGIAPQPEEKEEKEEAAPAAPASETAKAAEKPVAAKPPAPKPPAPKPAEKAPTIENSPKTQAPPKPPAPSPAEQKLEARPAPKAPAKKAAARKAAPAARKSVRKPAAKPAASKPAAKKAAAKAPAKAAKKAVKKAAVIKKEARKTMAEKKAAKKPAKKAAKKSAPAKKGCAKRSCKK